MNFQVALAIYMSANAYTSWEEDPIITTVKVISAANIWAANIWVTNIWAGNIWAGDVWGSYHYNSQGGPLQWPFGPQKWNSPAGPFLRVSPSQILHNSTIVLWMKWAVTKPKTSNCLTGVLRNHHLWTNHHNRHSISSSYHHHHIIIISSSSSCHHHIKSTFWY